MGLLSDIAKAVTKTTFTGSNTTRTLGGMGQNHTIGASPPGIQKDDAMSRGIFGTTETDYFGNLKK